MLDTESFCTWQIGVQDCPEVGYCALPLIGLEADGGGWYYDLGESWRVVGRGVLIRVDIILGYQNNSVNLDVCQE